LALVINDEDSLKKPNILAPRPGLKEFGRVLNLIITFKLSISDFVNLKLAISLDIDKLI
jgi:hypothetical protein